MADKEYTSADIQVLTDQEHVRHRPNMYFGSTTDTTCVIPFITGEQVVLKEVTFMPAVYKAVGEVLENSTDEMKHISQPRKTITINADPEFGRYSIADNGRGVPITMHASGLPTPQVVFGSLRSSRNFDDSTKLAGVIGMNGVGASCTCAASSDFTVIVHRDGKKYIQKFLDGCNKIAKPVITASPASVTGNTGTTVEFQLDPLVFKNVYLPPEMMQNRAAELALVNPGVVVEYNGTKYQFKRGMADLIPMLPAVARPFLFTFDQPDISGEILLVPNGTTFVDERFFTWVNSALLFDGGKINTQFTNALVDKVMEHLSKEAKKLKIDIQKSDVRHGLLGLGSLKIANPTYDSPAKLRMTGPDFKKEITAVVDEFWKAFVRKSEWWFQEILNRAKQRHHGNANSTAQKEHTKRIGAAIENLLDATGNKRDQCQLLITEGKSAAASITQVRDPRTTGSFALTGKINNVYGTTPAEALKMEKIGDLLASVGLVPGKKAVRSELRYGKIICATDSDQDGADLFTLLVNLFYHFWPELFDPQYPAIIHRLLAPNVCLSKGTTRVHFSTKAEYDVKKTQYSGYEVNYYKGLGSMTEADWKMILSGHTNTLVPITDDGRMKSVITLLFGDDAGARRIWLTADQP